MIELLIIRHGQSIADIEGRHEGRADFDLTPLGVEQAKEAAKWIASHYKVDKIYSSPLIRAKRTAEIIGDLMDQDVVIDNDLMEWNNGKLAGLLREEGMKKYPLPEGGRKPHDTFAETESLIEFRARAELWLSKFIHNVEHYNQRVCIVTHGGFINMLFRSFMSLPVISDLSISTGDTGIHLWTIDKDQKRIVFLNYREHLQK